MTDLPVEIPPVEGEEPEEELAATPTDEERSLLDSLRKMVERAVDVPEHEEFGAIEYEFHDAGLNLTSFLFPEHQIAHQFLGLVNPTVLAADLFLSAQQ